MDDQVDAVVEFRYSLDSETDRGCALMAAAFLDSEVERLLSFFVLDKKAVVKEMFGQSGPVGTFSSRIHLAYLLGLISPAIHRDLHLIRKIRNGFAHVYQKMTFDDPTIASRCRELTHHFRQVDERPREIFNSGAVGILALLHKTMRECVRIKELPNIDFESIRTRNDAKYITFEREFEGMPEGEEQKTLLKGFIRDALEPKST